MFKLQPSIPSFVFLGGFFVEGLLRGGKITLLEMKKKLPNVHCLTTIMVIFFLFSNNKINDLLFMLVNSECFLKNQSKLPDIAKTRKENGKKIQAYYYYECLYQKDNLCTFMA